MTQSTAELISFLRPAREAPDTADPVSSAEKQGPAVAPALQASEARASLGVDGPIQQKTGGDAAQAQAGELGALLSAGGAGRALPEQIQGKMEQSFNADFSNVRVHDNAAASSMGAAAFTSGSDIHFAPGRYEPHSSKGQQLLGHELSHVVQQQSGRVGATERSGGVPVNSDPGLEAEADRAGSRAARGEPISAGGRGSAGKAGVQMKAITPPAVQFFFDGKLKGRPWRFADDLSLAVRQDSKVYGGRHFYADAGLIGSATSTLKSQGSWLSMSTGGGKLDVTSPDGKTKKSLTRVVPTNTSDKSTGNSKSGGMKWPDDCGYAANAVMHGKGRATKGVYYKYTTVKQNWIQKVASWFTGRKSEVKKEEKETQKATYGHRFAVYRGRGFTSPHQMMEEIFSAVEGKKFDKAWKAYSKLNQKDREKFDQRLGINEYALPNVGEAYCIVANKDEHLDMKVWNFHWGAVVMRSGGDSVTMENFAGSGATAWDFQMYGPPSKPGQTFYEQQKSRTKHDGKTPEYGNNPTVIRVRSGK